MAGRWRKGESGNPKGRPPGIVDKRASLRKAFEDKGKAVAERCIAAALDGDVQAMRIVLERLAPPLKARTEPVEFPLNPDGSYTEQARQIMQAVSEGDVSPDVGRMLIDGIASMARVDELDEIRQRIEALEEASQ
ncbi:MAG: hypothetical protein HLUCCX14_05010 [Marinobacter excellens HL-55]|uniref:DUF5681 domain-containing protein n=1 Tax=Marinobacter excellens HL-55 TaxID=1305731 RepID=A0A0P7ZBL2_9GAMM|nr:MAG: hypothetical protein HLUCCX14_05010 [Marinobacter excellens HL-55]